MRDQVEDHLISPKNSALIFIDYRLPQVAFIASMDHRSLVENIAHALQDDVEASKYFHQAMETARAKGSIRLQVDASLGMTEILVKQIGKEGVIQLLALMAQGMSNREIADRLVLAVATVKWYGSQICSKVQVQNRVQAIARARELHILL